MIISVYHRFLQAVILLLVQCLLFSHMHILGYATPMPYILTILFFNLGAGRKALLLLGFVLGLIADMFTNTPGVSAASCTLLALLQPLILRLMAPRDCSEDLQPSLKTMGFWGFTRYAGVMTFLFHFVYYLLLVFSLAHPLDVLINIVGGTLFTTLLVVPLASLFQVKG